MDGETEVSFVARKTRLEVKVKGQIILIHQTKPNVLVPASQISE